MGATLSCLTSRPEHIGKRCVVFVGAALAPALVDKLDGLPCDVSGDGLPGQAQGAAPTISGWCDSFDSQRDVRGLVRSGDQAGLSRQSRWPTRAWDTC